jgi:hypothetical protein
VLLTDHNIVHIFESIFDDPQHPTQANTMSDEPETVEEIINDAMLHVMGCIVHVMLNARATAQADDNELRRAEVLREWGKVNKEMEQATETFQTAVKRALALPL